MQRVVVELTGQPVRMLTEDELPAAAASGLIGVEVTGRSVDGMPQTVVQVLFDDDVPGFDTTLLDTPIVADLVGPDGTVRAREPLDHDQFRRQLRAELDVGRSTTRGVLVLTGGALPPPWIRLAFLPVELPTTAGCTLILTPTTVEELVMGVERAHGAGELTDDERRTALATIEQRHPPFN